MHFFRDLYFLPHLYFPFLQHPFYLLPEELLPEFHSDRVELPPPHLWLWLQFQVAFSTLRLRDYCVHIEALYCTSGTKLTLNGSHFGRLPSLYGVGSPCRAKLAHIVVMTSRTLLSSGVETASSSPAF